MRIDNSFFETEEWLKKPFDLAHAMLDFFHLGGGSVRKLAERWGWNRDKAHKLIGQLTRQRLRHLNAQIAGSYEKASDRNTDSFPDTPVFLDESAENDGHSPPSLPSSPFSPPVLTKAKLTPSLTSSSYSTPSLLPPTVPQKAGQPKPAKPKTHTYSAKFEEFWKEYPRKVGKLAAYRIYQRPFVPQNDVLIEAVRRQKSSIQWRRDGGQYVPHPATWLNRAGWEDEEDRPIIKKTFSQMVEGNRARNNA